MPEVHKAVADAALRQNVLRVRRVFLDLLAQVVDVQPDVVRLVAVLVAPDLRQQLIVRNCPARVLDQVVEQAVLGRAQLDPLAVDDHLAAVEIYAQAVVDLEDRLRGRGRRHLGAAQHRLDPAGKLTRSERLGDVVVRAQFQPVDLVVLLAFGGQHDHRDRW